MENNNAKSWFEKAKPFIAAVFMQFGFAGMDVIAKAALNKGMSNFVLVVYRHSVAFLVIAPFGVYLERKLRPKMTLSIFIKLLALGALEPVIDQNMYVLGIKYTSPTFTSTMANIIPAITFFMAWIFRLEKIKIRSIRSQAKIAGTLTSVSGAMIMTLVKGPLLGLVGSHGGNIHNQHNGRGNVQHTVKGTMMITIGCISWSCFVILQAITLKSYPAELSLTAWICLLGAAEGAVVALIMERGNPSVWLVKWDVKLLAAVYGGIIASGLVIYFQGLVMKTRGPVFVTAFSPLCMVIVAIMSSIILFEEWYLGRVIGSIVIVSGLYLVVWGKSEDYGSPSSIIEDPVLPEKQIGDKGNAKMEHNAQGVITVGNPRAEITTRD